jgi:hypothetical protein
MSVKAACGLVGAAIGGVVVVVLAFCAPFDVRIWGTVASWVSGLLTSVAVAIALWKALDESRAMRRDKLGAQAEQVCAWYEGEEGAGTEAAQSVLRVANQPEPPDRRGTDTPDQAGRHAYHGIEAVTCGFVSTIP